MNYKYIRIYISNNIILHHHSLHYRAPVRGEGGEKKTMNKHQLLDELSGCQGFHGCTARGLKMLKVKFSLNVIIFITMNL